MCAPEKKYHAKLVDLFPISYLGDPDGSDGSKRAALDKLEAYRRILAVTDYVAGMTDTFAVNLFQKLSGIRLPE